MCGTTLHTQMNTTTLTASSFANFVLITLHTRMKSSATQLNACTDAPQETKFIEMATFLYLKLMDNDSRFMLRIFVCFQSFSQTTKILPLIWIPFFSIQLVNMIQLIVLITSLAIFQKRKTFQSFVLIKIKEIQII